jgi:tRNA 2-(methylsulfanyl)-N6-isopentenyladenosine37 hydroxylase
MVAEANHYKLFIQIAKHYSDEEKVKQRWEAWLCFEANVMEELGLRGDRVH